MEGGSHLPRLGVDGQHLERVEPDSAGPDIARRPAAGVPEGHCLRIDNLDSVDSIAVERLAQQLRGASRTSRCDETVLQLPSAVLWLEELLFDHQHRWAARLGGDEHYRTDPAGLAVLARVRRQANQPRSKLDPDRLRKPEEERGIVAGRDFEPRT